MTSELKTRLTITSNNKKNYTMFNKTVLIATMMAAATKA